MSRAQMTTFYMWVTVSLLASLKEAGVIDDVGEKMLQGERKEDQKSCLVRAPAKLSSPQKVPSARRRSQGPVAEDKMVGHPQTSLESTSSTTSTLSKYY